MAIYNRKVARSWQKKLADLRAKKKEPRQQPLQLAEVGKVDQLLQLGDQSSRTANTRREENPLFPTGIVAFSSGKERCGINEYSRGLNARMRLEGMKVTEARLDDSALLASAPAGANVLIHAEPCLLNRSFDEALRAAHRRGARIVTCFHHCDAAFLQRLAASSDILVTHRDYGITHPKLRIVPLACPVYRPADRAKLRQKHGLPKDKTILTTLGFLVRWKRMPELVEQLLPLVEQQGMLLQILAPTHFSGDPSGEGARLRRVVNGKPAIIWQADFLPEQEVLERAEASDLGLMYHGQNTGSCSAASKAFVSARCPLLVTPSSHDSDIRAAVRVSSFDINEFAKRAVKLAADSSRLEVLRTGMEAEYERMNMATVARQYLNLFWSIHK